MLRMILPCLLVLAASASTPVPSGAAGKARVPATAKAQPQPQPASDEIIIHRLRPGETVATIAATALVSAALLPDVLALNRITATQPLPIGFPVRLRTSWLRHDLLTAEIVAFTGQSLVEIGAGSTAVALGMNLTEGDRIITSVNGFVTLRLGDGSKVALPSNSNVRIERLRRMALTGAVDRRFRLDEGGVETRVAPLRPDGSRFLITTPVSIAAVRGTRYRVGFTPESMHATTEVLEGRVAVSHLSSGAAAQGFLLTPGFGAVADRSLVAPPVRLLAAPAIDGAVLAVQSGKTVDFRVRPLAGAVRYRFEISLDEEGLERIASKETEELRLSFEGIGNGRHYVHVTAIDANGLAGWPASQPFDRRQAVDQGQTASIGAEGVQLLGHGPDGTVLLEEGSAFADGQGIDQFSLAVDPAGETSAAASDGAVLGSRWFGSGGSGAPWSGGAGGGAALRGNDGDDSSGVGGVVPVTPPGNGGSPGGGTGGGGTGGGGTGGGIGGSGFGGGGIGGGGIGGGGGTGGGGNGSGTGPGPGGGDTGSGGNGSGGNGSGGTGAGNGEFGGSGVTPIPGGPTLPVMPEAGPTTAIPEPATWLMLLTGFGLIGHMVRRRRRQDALYRLHVGD